MAAPQVVVIFSGKRKSGKDFTTDLLLDRLGGDAEILRLSGPLKAAYAEDHNLDLQKLLGTSEYKEQFRLDMIRWSEEKRAEDPGYFCRLATAKAARPVWIVSDARRPTDLAHFNGLYRTITVRVESSLECRKARGFVHNPSVDDAASECGLDRRTWDVVLHNEGLDGASAELLAAIDALAARAQACVAKGRHEQEGRSTASTSVLLLVTAAAAAAAAAWWLARRHRGFSGGVR